MFLKFWLIDIRDLKEELICENINDEIDKKLYFNSLELLLVKIIKYSS